MLKDTSLNIKQTYPHIPTFPFVITMLKVITKLKVITMLKVIYAFFPTMVTLSKERDSLEHRTLRTLVDGGEANYKAIRTQRADLLKIIYLSKDSSLCPLSTSPLCPP